jgi:DNA-binding SARP family transcriptional activator/tetratricopeptide (TPR) repeat protein
MMAPPLPYLRVLGTPVLFGPDGETIVFRTRKHFALLIYLALEPQAHRREKLAALLWPRVTMGEARHSLSTALSVLRARLGAERIETNRDTARLLPGSIEIDLERLARGEIHATELTAALDIAPLLHDFPVSDAVPWEQWRDGLAAKWQPAIREALLARIDRMRRQGNTRTMEVLADALLSLDDLSEDGVRAKMESRAFAGDRLTALQIYEGWRVRLADELGAQPSDLVAGMATRLRRRGWERTSEEHIPAVRTDQWKDRPFVGRAKEYEVLYEGWEGCERGAAQHVLIAGESGVGKSTLMERLTTAAGLQGAIAVRVQCHAVEREIPYGAIGSLIGMLLDQPGATGVAPEWLSELSRMVSAVRRKFPNVAPPPEATGEMVRIRLADAFHELVRAVADEQPLILVMDDIHLGDDASVAVMHLLLRRLTDERVLVLCTLRQGEEALAPSARGMMERAELARMVVLPLPPLDEAESSELLGQLIPDGVQPPPGTVRRALLRAGSGLPMLLELLARDWMAHGDRCVALSVGAMTEDPDSAGGAGETYRRLLERLTVALDSTTRSVLNLAAILGSQLNEFELYSLVDLTLAQAMAGLSQLASARIMRDSGHGLEFVNEVMRGEVYLGVPSSVRKVLHSKVADRLIQRSQDGEDMLGLAIAWHCVRSGRVQEAGDWLIAGGREALGRSALAEAEAALESGSRHLPLSASRECSALLIEVYLDQGRLGEAHLLSHRVSAQADFGVSHHPIKQLASLAVAGTVPATQRDSFDNLLSLLPQLHSAEHRLQAASLASSIASVVREESLLQRFATALADARNQAPPHQIHRYDLLIAQAHYWLRDTEKAERILRDLLSHHRGDGPSMYRFNLQIGLGACRVSLGDYEGSLDHAEEAVRIAVRAGAAPKEATALGNLAVAHFRLGHFDAAYTCATRAASASAAPHSYQSAVPALGVGLVVAAIRDDKEDFARRLQDAGAMVARPRSPALHGLAYLWIADGLLINGREQESLESAKMGLASFSGPHIGSLGTAARWAAALLRKAHDPIAAQALRDALRLFDRLDVLDRLEAALAIMEHPLVVAHDKHALIDAATRASSQLPLPTRQLLTRLGVRWPDVSELTSARASNHSSVA